VLRLVRLAALFAAIGLFGCGGASLSPSKPPARADAQSTRIQKSRLPPPKLIAPPPAYGNKIVMASRSGEVVVN